jgi:X-domain of DnaJ-containing
MARKIMDERFLQVAPLTAKLIKRLRPYVEAKHTGEEDVHATVAFVNMIKREAEDLKKESFGAEVSGSFTS